jgi:hypothetical protein
MKTLLQTILARFMGDGGKLMGTLGLFFVIWGTIAPISTLAWWFKGGNDLNQQPPELEKVVDRDRTSPRCYLIFLTGVGDMAAETLAPGEADFLDRLEAEITDCVVVRDVFPYSVATENVGGQPIFNWLWQISEASDSPLDLANLLLKIRNLWRVALSADDRYGQVYNPGAAAIMVERMTAAHPLPDSADPPLQIILIGTSGGAQVALGAAPYLKAWLPTELTIISIGGIFEGEDGFDTIEQFYHLYGENDWIDNLGSLMFPSRWRWTWRSPFNRARRAGRYQAILLGAHEHDGDRGYFGQTPVGLGEGSYLDLTLEQVLQLPIWDNE